MKNRFHIVCLLALSAGVHAQHARLDYRLRWLSRASDSARLGIELRFIGEADGLTELRRPERWAYITDYQRGLADLSVSGGRLDTTGGRWVVRHRPRAALTVRYSVGMSHTGQFDMSHRYRPYVRPDGLHAVGYALWVTPDWGDSTVNLGLDWRGLPNGWRVASSHHVGRRYSGLVKLNQLRDALYLSGPPDRLRVLERRIAGQPLYVAVRGRWPWADTAFAAMTAHIVHQQREFWGEHDFPHYLISVQPFDETKESFGGTMITNAFALLVPEPVQPALDHPAMAFLLAHEHQHNWTPTRLGRIAGPEERLYWFTEGFTDYYAHRTLRASGFYSDSAYSATLNEKLERYWRSPRRNDPVDSVEAGFWRDGDLQRLPYQQGELLALYWQAQLVRQGKTIDSLMRALRRAARQNPAAALSDSSIIATMRRATGLDILPDIESVVHRGANCPLDSSALGPDYRLIWLEREQFEIGFDIAVQKRDSVIAGVTEATAAYAAGLRNGQRVRRRPPIYLGETNQTVEVTIVDPATPGGERTIRYRPVAAERPRVPQYVRR